MVGSHIIGVGSCSPDSTWQTNNILTNDGLIGLALTVLLQLWLYVLGHLYAASFLLGVSKHRQPNTNPPHSF